MSIFNFIFDSEWSQRSDIEDLKQKNIELASKLYQKRPGEATLEKKIHTLEQEVGELALLSKTLMRILMEKGVCTGQEFEALMHQFDLEDGVADGKVTKPSVFKTARCPKCNHPIQPQWKRCLYCSTAILHVA